MKFSVIIPTRERADTLYYSLKTCVTQDYSNLDILVSDNFSQDNTREVVNSFNDPRIRYINTGKRVGMSSNWEFALNHVRDGHVMILGDDDGLLPSAIQDCSTLIQTHSMDVLSWHPGWYTWPSFPILDQRNQLSCSMNNFLVHYDAKSVIRAISNIIIEYGRLPMIYSSFVSMDIISKIKSKSGLFFHSITPDIYSGFAILSGIKEYYYSWRPFSIAGMSGHSTGSLGCSPNRNDTESGHDNLRLHLAEADVSQHSRMHFVPGSVTTIVLEALFKANDHCFDGKLRPNVKRAFSKAIQELLRNSSDPEEALAALKDLAKLNGVYGHFERACRRAKKSLPSRILGRGYFSARGITMDASPCGVQDVAQAADLVYGLVGKYDMQSTIVRQTYLRMLAARFLQIITGTFRHLTETV